jgi:hypothetical protein
MFQILSINAIDPFAEVIILYCILACGRFFEIGPTCSPDPVFNFDGGKSAVIPW